MVKGVRVSAEQQHWADEDDDEAPVERDSTVIRELRKINNSQSRKIKELEEQLSSFAKTARTRTVAELLESRDLNPKIAAFIPDTVEPTAEALGKWLDDYADVFGAAPAKQAEPPSENLAALRQMDSVMSGATSAPGANDLRAAIANASSVEELDALIARSAGQ